MIATLFVLMLSAAVASFVQSRYPPAEARIIGFSWGAHVIGAFAQIAVTSGLYSGGDMFGYYTQGSALATWMQRDFSRWAPEVLALIQQHPATMPTRILGVESATGSMAGLTAVLVFFAPSLYAVTQLIALGAFVGNVALYQALRDQFPAVYRQRLLLAATLVPSVVFWSSGILKESIVMCALGWSVLGISDVVRGDYRRGIPLALAGVYLISLVKAYIVFSLAIAAGGWWYWDRSIRVAGRDALVARPAYAAVGLGAATGAVLVLGRLFPQFAPDSLGDQLADLQTIGQRVRGHSYAQIGDSTQRGLAGQLVYAPFALFSALFRPIPLEARNAQMAVNSAETTYLLVLLIQAWRMRGFAGMWASLARFPMLVFALIVTVVLGVGVGLGSTNLGSLSRYRMPLVPLFAVLLVVWTAPKAWEAAKKQKPASAEPDPVPASQPEPLRPHAARLP